MTRDQLLATEPLRPNEDLRGLLGAAGEDGQTTVTVPWLAGVGPYHTPSIRCHKRVAAQLQRAFELIDQAGCRDQVLTYDGCYVYRAQRGATVLSAHAYGAAVDLNAEWNGLGQVPPNRGAKGSVIGLRGIFAACGFGWGGFYRRPDGMHFQVHHLMSAAELPTLDSGMTLAYAGQQIPMVVRNGHGLVPLATWCRVNAFTFDLQPGGIYLFDHGAKDGDLVRNPPPPDGDGQPAKLVELGRTGYVWGPALWHSAGLTWSVAGKVVTVPAPA